MKATNGTTISQIKIPLGDAANYTVDGNAIVGNKRTRPLNLKDDDAYKKHYLDVIPGIEGMNPWNSWN